MGLMWRGRVCRDGYDDACVNEKKITLMLDSHCGSSGVE